MLALLVASGLVFLLLLRLASPLLSFIPLIIMLSLLFVKILTKKRLIGKEWKVNVRKEKVIDSKAIEAKWLEPNESQDKREFWQLYRL